MKLLFTYVRRYRTIVFVAMLLAALNQVFSLCEPIIFRQVIDTVILREPKLVESEFLRKVLFFLGLSIGAAFLSRTAKNFQDYVISIIVQKIGAEMYSDGLRHSLELPYSVFEDQRSGETLGILQKARTDVERLINASISVLFTTIVGVVFVAIYAYSVHWMIVPIYFSAIPVIGFVSSKLSKRIKTMQKNIIAKTAALSGSTTESLRNIELVKSMGLAQQEIQRLNSTTSAILDLELTKVRYIRSLSFAQGTIVNFLRTSILFLMFYLVFGGVISTGALFSLFMFSFFIFGPLQELGSIINVYREAEVSLGNFERILNTPIEVRPSHPVSIGRLESITLRDVTFSHQTATNRPALNSVSVEIRKGETVAFVGPSGSGKTTLVKLLVGLYSPKSGVIMCNNIDYKELDIEYLRSRIGYVTQDTQLFSGTIRENLLFVNPNADDAQCLDVLHKAACDSILTRAEQGLDTMVGEGGVKVSGGERQRLSIARALLRQPDVLIFDEATSALDSLTEEEITETIRSITNQKEQITLMVAHRLSTIMHADHIYVLEKGRIIESGTHIKLLAEKGLYYAMWRQQIGEV